MSVLTNMPNPGETVLHCGHERAPGETHFFGAALVFSYRRRDGTEGWTRWIVCCDACYQRAGGDSTKVPKRAEAVWDGSIPKMVKEQRL